MLAKVDRPDDSFVHVLPRLDDAPIGPAPKSQDVRGVRHLDGTPIWDGFVTERIEANVRIAFLPSIQLLPRPEYRESTISWFDEFSVLGT
mmetsp:Transcript_15923/g.34331  ORF Transcript_15923/g.34331 Transcript_15923/m.34331 type:complete len:90 (-) Transcript_15923:2178-2447(-)